MTLSGVKATTRNVYARKVTVATRVISSPTWPNAFQSGSSPYTMMPSDSAIADWMKISRGTPKVR